MYNNSGALVAQYEYDAWGNTLSVTDASGNEITAWYNIANANPIRYRGYYYDADLGLYYLQSRYYDATIGRFINADEIDYLGTKGDFASYNLFVYCGNNPLLRIDTGGEVWHIVAGGIIGGVTSFLVTLLSEKDVKKALVSGAFGAVSGALTAALPAAGFAIDVGLGVVEELVLNNMSEKPSNTLSKDIAISTGIDATSSISSNGSRLNKKNMQEFVETIPKMTKGNHPKVKGTAKKIYRRTGRKILREAGETFIEKSACNIFEVILKAIF